MDDDRCDWCSRKIDQKEEVISAVGHNLTRFCSWECHDAWCVDDREMREELRQSRREAANE